ncbi:MAG: hypothetical protein HYV34_04250 [Candidatus Kerfeldbacteria bacterium]|nr:hypothetical protein [Candidatus Kerfeldbacteria bacterium]
MSCLVVGKENLITRGVTAMWSIGLLPKLQDEVAQARSVIVALESFARGMPNIDQVLRALDITLDGGSRIRAIEGHRLVPGEILLVPALGQRITFKRGVIRPARRESPNASRAIADNRGSLSWIDDLFHC